MKYKVTNSEAVGKIARRERFSNSTGSFTGTDIGVRPTGYRFGWLPEWANRELSKVGRAFVVFSYATLSDGLTTSAAPGWCRGCGIRPRQVGISTCCERRSETAPLSTRAMTRPIRVST